MSAPSVCCIMLADDRQAMVERAVRAWRVQQYDGNCDLLILDSGKESIRLPNPHGITHIRTDRMPHDTIGRLRNLAAECAPASDIIIHWDSDDWSAPERVAEQVELLQKSGADAVGYREMLFWDIRKSRMMCDSFGGEGPEGPRWFERKEAWLYANHDPRYCLGTSLCYWRRTWERKPFPERNVGEDLEWIRGLNTGGISSIPNDNQPRMIASIHGANTTGDVIRPASSNWSRVPQWDVYCAEVMRL